MDRGGDCHPACYLCNRYPFYWSRQSMVHTVTTVLHIPQTCSPLKSLCKYCLFSKWNQNPILWPNPPRYPLCIFPLKMPLRIQKSPFAEALQESMSKITELCTHRHLCSHTHGVGNQNILYLRECRERLARDHMAIRSDQDVRTWGP